MIILLPLFNQSLFVTEGLIIKSEAEKRNLHHPLPTMSRAARFVSSTAVFILDLFPFHAAKDQRSARALQNKTLLAATRKSFLFSGWLPLNYSFTVQTIED